MAYCIQCGEPLALDSSTCPACGRAVGASSLGAARERQAGVGARRALGVAALAAGLVVAGGAGLMLVRARSGLSAAQADAAARLAARSLVEVEGPSASCGGVVVRSLQGALVIVTQAAAAPTDREVRVVANGRSARGFGLLAGIGRSAPAFALVLVPEGAALGLEEARVADRPTLDQPLVALAPGGAVAGHGRVLSFEDGPGAGTLVHDARMDAASRGLGLWTDQGRLGAVPVMAPSAGDNLAVAASTLFERLLLHELPIVAGAEWSEHALPMGAGTRLAVVLAADGADRLVARIGDHGKVARARLVWPGLAALELVADEAGALQLGGSLPASDAPRRVLVVSFGRL